MAFADEGYALWPALLDSGQCAALRQALDRLSIAPGRGGLRRIDALCGEVAALARAPALLTQLQACEPGPLPLVRAIYFDKSPTNNWLVSWHQDRTVAVSQRFEADGWGPWSLKAGVWHVQPPLSVLRSMVTVRVHLDAASADNGCLKLLPASHGLGILSAADIAREVQQRGAVCAEAAEGDALLMRPLLLHASAKAVRPLRRRVLHFEYAAHQLPAGVDWAA